MSRLSTVSITSEKDYLRIFQDGQVTISANGTPDADSTFPADPYAPFGFAGFYTIDHNLGYVPMVRAFWDPNKNGVWYNSGASGGYATDPWLKTIITTTQLKLIMNTDGAAKTDIPVFYRIYDFNSVAVNSDSRIDKIFFSDESQVTLSAAASSAVNETIVLTIPHGGNVPPLWTMQFSEDRLDWYNEGLRSIGLPDLTSGPPGGPYSYYYTTSCYAYVDATNLYIHASSNYASPKTIYLRFSTDYRN